MERLKLLPLYPTLYYWRNEQSGDLAKAVERYFSNEFLTERNILNLKAYLLIWANYIGFDQNERMNRLKALTNTIATREDIASWIELAIVEGIDPF